MNKEELQILLSVSQNISNSWNDETLFSQVLNKIQPILDFDDVAIHVWENDHIAYNLVTSSAWSRLISCDTSTLQAQKSLWPKDSPYTELKKIQKPTIYYTKDWLNKFPDSVISQLQITEGYVQEIALPLWKNDTVIGVVEFFGKRNGQFEKAHIELFKLAVDQLSLAVLKLISNYELIKQKKEKKALLKLAELMSSVANKNDLIALVNKNIKSILNYHGIGLYLFTEGQKYHWNFLDTELPLTLVDDYQILAAQEELLTSHEASPLEWLAENSERNNGPILFNFEDLIHAFPNYSPLGTGQEAVDKSGMSSNLRLKDKVVGIFFIHSSEEGIYNEREFILFQAITDQISIAIQKVLINEQVLERQIEKEVLLSISEEISKSRTKSQLFQTVSQKIKPIFNFHDMGLFILSENGKYHQDLAIDAPEVHSSEWNLSLSQMKLGKTLHENTPIQYIIDQVTDAGQALLFDNEELYRKFPHYIQFQSSAFKNTTYRDCLATTLKVGQKVIGMFCINSIKENLFKKEQYSLFQSIADQLAVAVSNILANEEILKSETEKSLQLDITDALSDEGNWEDRFSKIPQILDGHLPFKILSFAFLMNDVEDDKSFRYLKEDGHFKVLRDKPFYKKTGLKKESFLQHRHSLSQRESTWQNKSDLEENVNPVTNKIRKAFDINSIFIQNISLSKGNRLILMALDSGTDSYNLEHIELFQKINNSLSLSLEKLLAYEEVLHHKQEKEELLNLSEKIASIRNRKELLGILKGQLKGLFHYDDIAVSINTKDMQHHWLMVSAVMKVTDIQDRFHVHKSTTIPNDRIYQKVIASSVPLMFSFDDFVEMDLPEEDINMVKASGIKHVVGVPLNQGGQNIGGIFMLSQTPVFSKHQFGMYKNTADQISTAVSNILNNEEILKRQQEKEIMLSISEKINQGRSRNDIMKLMSEEIKELFGFEFTSLVFQDDDSLNYTQWVLNPTGDLETKAAFRKIQKNIHPLKESLFKEYLDSNDIISIPTQEIIEKYPEYPGTSLYQDYDLKSLTIIPLTHAGQTLGLWLFNSKHSDLLSSLNLRLLENTASQLAIALSSIMASEDVVKREKLQSLQVKIQNAFNYHEKLSGKLKETIEVFRDVIPFDYISFNIDISGERARSLGFRRTENDDFEIISSQHFYKLTGLTFSNFKELEQNNSQQKALYFNSQDFSDLCLNSKLISIYHKKFDINSCLLIPLKINNKGESNIEFFSHRTESYSQEHIELLTALEYTFTIGLERFLAQEEIVHLNQQLHQEKQYLEEEININYNFGELVGESEGIRKVFRKIEQVASTDTTVLVTGETGTGKEVIARAIHNSSDRKDKPLVKLNCAALPPQLMESELFGHEKGSFTGATSRRIGKFELANKGTIFLDEIGEMPLELQAKLLRVLQEKEVERVGGNTVIKVDVRIITATNRKLEEEIANNLFRSDLFYRLNVFPINIPPLRERKDDILPLANHFLKIKSKRIGKHIEVISPESSKQLLTYDWPGNIRELEHVIERGLILSKGNMLRVNLGDEISFNITPIDEHNTNEHVPFKIKTIAEVERELIMNTLSFTEGRVRGEGGAAQLLGLKPTTLEARMKKLGIRKNISYQKEQKSF